MFSARLEQALTLVGLRHAGQTRKDTGAPYLTHLAHVARIVAAYGYDEDHEIVALLHDVLEDTCYDEAERRALFDEIKDRFGGPIAAAVRVLSEPKRGPDQERLRWPERKRAYLEALEQASPLALRVSAADKTHNLATMLAGLEREGPGFWSRFRGGAGESAWFYRAVHEVLARRLEDPPIVRALGAFVEALEARVEADAAASPDEASPQ